MKITVFLLSRQVHNLSRGEIILVQPNITDSIKPLSFKVKLDSDKYSFEQCEDGLRVEKKRPGMPKT